MTANGLLTAVLSIVFVAVWHYGALGSVLGNLVTAAVFFVVLYAYLRKHLAWEFSWKIARESLVFGLPDVPVRVSRWALKLADRLILQRFLPLSVVGLYSVGYSLGSMPFELIASSTAIAILPFFYRTATEESEHDSKALFAIVAAYDAALLGFLGLGTVLFAREAILLFTTSRYLEAESIVPYVVWASVCEALSFVPARGIYLMKRTAALPVLYVAPAAINIGLNFVLVPRYGMIGAAWATLLAYPVMLAWTLWLAQRVYPIPYDYVRIAKPLVLAVGLSLLTNVVTTESMVLAIMLKTLLLAAFPALLLVSGFVTRDERRALGRLAYQPVLRLVASSARK
jgi:O-antigen/teichoic acid export membrane protein